MIEIQCRSRLELTRSTNQLSRSFLVRMKEILGFHHPFHSRLWPQVDLFVWLRPYLRWHDEFLGKIFKYLRMNSFNVRRIFSPFVSLRFASFCESLLLGGQWSSSRTNACFTLGFASSESSSVGLRNRSRRDERRERISFVFPGDEKSV